MRINLQGRVCFVRMVQHKIFIKRTVILPLPGFHKVDTFPVNSGEKNENIKNMPFQASPWEPAVASNGLAFDVSGSETLRRG